MGTILIICGVYWVIFSLITNTKSLLSAIIFKIIPFFTGLATIICAMDVFGWINIF